MDTPVMTRRAVEAYTPPGSPRTYQIAPLMLRERMAARAAVIAEGGVYPSQEQMYEAMRTTLREAEVENLAELLEVLDAAEQASLLSGGEPIEPELQAQVARIETACQTSPAYTALIGRRIRHLDAVPLVYFLHAVRGWEGTGLPAFARRGGLVREDLLESVPEDELRLVGMQAYALAKPGAVAAGNSEGPLPSSGPRKSGQAGSTRRTGGRGTSPARSGKKTLA